MKQSEGVARMITLSFTLIMLVAVQPATSQQLRDVQARPVSEVATDVFPRARAAVEAHLLIDLDPAIQLRIVTGSTMAKHVEAEAYALLMGHGKMESEAREAAQLLGQEARKYLAAKYLLSTKEILLCAERLAESAAILKQPQLLSSQCLAALLTHELIHAADLQCFEIDQRSLESLVVLRISPFAAVLEGHAQLVAREVCAKNGWSEGMDVWTASIVQLPPVIESKPAPEQLMARMRAATFSTLYIDGERFMKTLKERGGPAIMSRVFEHPPADIDLIYHPEWYLDPRSRTIPTFDLNAELRWLDAELGVEGWKSRYVVGTRAELCASWSMLDQSVVDRMADSVVSNCAIAIQPTGYNMIIGVTLIEWETHDSALHSVLAVETINHLKDSALLKRGELESAEYVMIDKGPVTGFAVYKRFTGEISLRTAHNVNLARNRLTVEVTVANIDSLSEEDVLDMAETLLAHAFQGDAPPK